jgi:anti-anti-sigma regulatory factor
VPATLEQKDALTTIQLEGAIDIGCAAELKAALVEAVAPGRTIRVSAEGASELDVTAYQLLWAASREAKRSGAWLVLAGRMPEPVRVTLAEMGLDVSALFE